MRIARFVALAIVAAIVAFATGPSTQTSAAGFTVNSTGDAVDAIPGNGVCATAGGVCTLRAAIQEANALAGADIVNFNIPSATDPGCNAGSQICTITPASGLPNINEQLTINGFTQPGSSANTNPVSAGSNAVLKIELNGTTAGLGVSGLNLNIGSGTVVRGLVINRFTGSGILVGVTGSTVAGNYIGTDPSGASDLGNSAQGVDVSSATNTIGGSAAADRNVISGNNQHGVNVTGSSSTIVGNYIGTNAAGSADLGNTQNGMFISSSSNCVGGTIVAMVCTGAAGAENVISGNDFQGVEINGPTVQSNTVYGNLVGTNAAGTAGVGNTSHGIIFLSAINNVIGGTGGNQANRIAFNGGDGVFVSSGTGNAVRGNRIYSNTGLGVDLGPNGLTPNDGAGDPDGGANNLQNFPVITAAYSGSASTVVRGSLTSAFSTSFAIHFYTGATCDSSGNGEGETFFSSTNVATDAAGLASLDLTLGVSAPLGQFLTATATRNATPLDTSEFSACVPITHIVVNSTADPGDGLCNPTQCTLREAITTANSATGTDTIDFNIAGAGPHTISPTSALPAITQPAVIDGYTQPGAAPNTNPIASGSNAVLKIELNGTNAGSVSGLSITGGGSTIRGLVINRFTQHGISLTTTGGNTIAGAYLGTDVAGTADLGNGGSGVLISSTASNTVGGTAAADRNLISGNNAQGLTITGTTATGNQVLGSLIGTQANGTTGLANGGDGVHIDTSAANNTIGGTGAGAANTIAFNVSDGVNLVSTAGTGNSIRANSIHSNGSATNQLGIDLGLNGVTPNDTDDIDTGPNNLQNFPVLTLAIKKGGGTLVEGTINSDTSASGLTYNLDFFANATCDAGANGEGARYLGSSVLTTSPSGGATFFPVVGATALGEIVTATATRAAAPLDTSEFSNCVTVGPMVVDTTSDNSLTTCRGNVGDCSLRGAITNANSDANADVINFDVPACPGGICTITPASALPTVSQPLTIDGYTQPGVAANTNDTSSGLNAALKIELNGASAGGGVNGLLITGGDTLVRGLAINGFTQSGINLQTGDNNAVAGNYIGTNVAGDSDLGNGVDGIQITSGSGNNCIGGTFVSSICTATSATRNLISGNNDDGVQIASAPTQNFVKGNIIGLNAAGTGDLGNTGDGVVVSPNPAAAMDNLIGAPIATAAPQDRNIISGNDANGVFITDATGNNDVFGNYIGTDVTGNLDLGNTMNGVATSGTASGADIGSTGGSRNVISGNDMAGVSLSGAANEDATVHNNYIGANAAGTAAVANTGNGVIIDTGGNSVGTVVQGYGNLISGNLGNGVRLFGTNADDNHIWGNTIGAAANTALPIKNNLNGVLLETSADLNHIGLTTTGNGLPNLIAFNGGDGVRVDGMASISNTIRANTIHSNVGKAIENFNGGNALLVPPVITAAGSASGTACANCTVDVYSDGVDEGRVYHGSAVANGAGAWSYAGPVTGPNVTATATDAAGNTSEFSTPYTSCADTDGDKLCNSGDACPNDTDCDNDGWSDGNELAFIGTDYQDACPDNVLDNAWPADLNNDGLVDVIGDISLMAGVFSLSVPPAPARYDVGEPPNGTIGVIDDIVRLTALYAQSCVP